MLASSWVRVLVAFWVSTVLGRRAGPSPSPCRAWGLVTSRWGLGSVCAGPARVGLLVARWLSWHPVASISRGPSGGSLRVFGGHLAGSWRTGLWSWGEMVASSWFVPRPCLVLAWLEGRGLESLLGKFGSPGVLAASGLALRASCRTGVLSPG